MKTVSVAASRPYDILIGSGLLTGIGQLVASLGNASKITVVSDSNVFPIYGEVVTSQLSTSGFDCNTYVFPAGEEYKNAGTYLSLLNHLAQHQLNQQPEFQQHLHLTSYLHVLPCLL